MRFAANDKVISVNALVNKIEEKIKRLDNLDTINGLLGAINIAYELPPVEVANGDPNSYGGDGE